MFKPFFAGTSDSSIKHYFTRSLITGLIMITIASAEAWAGVAEDVRMGNKFYRQEKYDEALQKYDRALSEKPDDPVIQYNRGITLYRKREFDKAAGAFLKSLGAGDEHLEERTVYNTGNSEFRIGEGKEKQDPGSALLNYKRALEHYKRTMELDSSDRDAKYNYEFTLKKMRELQKKQQDQQQQQEQKDQQEKEQQQDRQQQKQQEQQKDKEKQQEKQEEEEKKRQEQEQKEKERQRQEQQEREEQEKRKEKEKEQFPKDRKPDKIEEPEGEMSEEEAEMLLRSQDEEEARARAEQTKKSKYRPTVLRDW